MEDEASITHIGRLGGLDSILLLLEQDQRPGRHQIFKKTDRANRQQGLLRERAVIVPGPPFLVTLLAGQKSNRKNNRSKLFNNPCLEIR